MTKHTKPAAILRSAIALLSNPDNWCQYNMTADHDGLACEPHLASRWCAVGAIDRFAKTRADADRVRALFTRGGREPIAVTNDFGGREAALRRMRRMLGKLERRQAKRMLRRRERRASIDSALAAWVTG